MYDFLTPRSQRRCNQDDARLRWDGYSTVMVTIGAKWLRELDIANGDHATMFTNHRLFTDSLLIVKAPFMGSWGNIVRIKSATSNGYVHRACKPQLIDILFRQHNKRLIVPDIIKIVMLESNIKALALRCPEVEEYLKIKKEIEMANQVVQPPVVETEAMLDALMESGRDEDSQTSDANCVQNGDGAEPDHLQTPELNSNVIEEDCCYSENTQEESPIS